MGCGSSRFDRRNKLAGDFNTVALQFVGGESHAFDGFPFDRVLWALNKDKEAEVGEHYKVDGEFKATDQEQVKAIFKATFLHDEATLKGLEEKYGKTAADAKAIILNDKYTHTEAISQMKDVIEHLKKSGISVTEEKKDEAKKEEAPAGEMMEGGDEMAAAADVDAGAGMGMEAHSSSPFKYDTDSHSYEGWEALPAILLRNLIVNPYWGDQVKAEAIAWEFNPEKGKTPAPQLIPFVPLPDIDLTMGLLGGSEHPYTPAAALISASVSKS
jgi:hypothetical protein